MDNMDIADDLYLLIKDLAEEENIHSVKYIKLVIGKALEVNKKGLFKKLQKDIFPGTICKNTKLDIVEESVKLKCRKCSKIMTPDQKFFVYCNYCGGHDFDIIQGRKIYIDKIEGKTKQ
ncbi:MAG: hydrogenase maturation nickel metallochaperone HypA [Candidatus Mcinerneyibacterium aminivorans]|uniref:Hydrogenase maturation nickel metallochaperone HypA n=1 Tax=Candidatus Mcinerneyibacterium aminivorans TaxID=2703815 RepID=A0A5D0MJW4_9BACT|nr:MAG: hydrogenase maturation nickel metallochaperone HypA [Candidatus Mcinerneyibacterium aminivorans]